MKNRTFAPLIPHLRRLTAPKRRRGHAGLFVLGAMVAGSSLTSPRPATAAAVQAAARGPAAAAAQNTVTFLFDIQPGSIETVIGDFTRITGLRVSLADPTLGMVTSAGVRGTLSAEAAMAQLLAGSSITATFGDGVVNLGIGGVSESVEVIGRAATVSSPRYTVPLRDIAQTVALIPRTVIEAQGATTLSEAMRNVPGITLQAGEGGGSSSTAGDMFNMRGFNAANSLFVDNVRDDGLISRDVFNLEQVEVFMGPTGSDVGRGTAAGYVNMQTKTPHLGSSHTVLMGAGSAEQARISADFNWAAPTVAGNSWLAKSAIRLNAVWQDRGVPGRDQANGESRAVAPAVALGLGTPTRVFGSAQVVRQDNEPDYGVPGAAWPTPLAPTTALASGAVRQANYYGSPAYDYDRAEQESYLGRIEHDVNRNLTLRNQTRYNRTHRGAVISAIQNVAAFNPDTNLVTITRQGNDRQNRILSNQTMLVQRFATGRLRHGVSATLEFAREDQFAPTLAGLGTRAPVDIFSPNPSDPVTGYAPVRTGAESRGSTDTVALSAFDTVELSQRWQVSGGLRWEHYDTAFRTLDAAGATTADLAGADAIVSGKASVLFRASEAGNVYLSYGTTVTPPGSANFTLSAQINNQNNPSVQPQKSANLEVGTKWDVAGGRLSLNGAAFRTTNENVIYTIDATAVPPLYNQDDAQLVKGVTVGALGRVTDRWEVLANIGYLDTRLETQNSVNNGRRLTLTPRFSGSVWTTYRLPRGISVGGGIRHTDAVFVNAANTLEVPGYQLIDGLVEYALNAHLSLRVNVYNLTNEVYIRNVSNNGGRYNPGNPRSAMLTSQVRF
jgi:catecholate siderophore receptor